MSLIKDTPDDEPVPGSTSVLVIVSGREPKTIAVQPGTTVEQLANLLDVNSQSAVNGAGDPVGPDHIITAADDRLAFIGKITGA